MASTQESKHTEKYMSMLRKVYEGKDRDSQNMVLITYIGELQQQASDEKTLSEFDAKLLEFYESEWDHQYLVCTALRRIGNKRRHDWTKDYVYVYALSGKFCFNVQHQDFGDKWLQEVNRHYKLEPHHPQHTQTGGAITKMDVEETALDQLAREVYRFKGKINAESMRKYLPKFEGPDGEKKLEWFLEYVDKHTELMKTVYREFIKDEEMRKSKAITK